MSNRNINTYRLTELKEPTKAQLAKIMKEAAKEAKKKSKLATDALFLGVSEQIEMKKDKLSKKYNIKI